MKVPHFVQTAAVAGIAFDALVARSLVRDMERDDAAA